jgi:hypothetical protein
MVAISAQVCPVLEEEDEDEEDEDEGDPGVGAEWRKTPRSAAWGTGTPRPLNRVVLCFSVLYGRRQSWGRWPMMFAPRWPSYQLDCRRSESMAEASWHIQGTFGAIQGTFGAIQGTFGAIQGIFGAIQGTFGAV